jgi:hypothetical protein
VKKNPAKIDPYESLYDFVKYQAKEIYPAADRDQERKRLMQMSELWAPSIDSQSKTKLEVLLA